MILKKSSVKKPPVSFDNLPTGLFPRIRLSPLPNTFGAAPYEILTKSQLKRHSAKNMPVGHIGYVPPWAIYRAPEGIFLQADFPVFNAPDEKINIKIERVSPHQRGFYIHANEILLSPFIEKCSMADIQCWIVDY
ncbi:MAG: hypothetical protein V1661_02645 [bacterium]